MFKCVLQKSGRLFLAIVIRVDTLKVLTRTGPKLAFLFSSRRKRSVFRPLWIKIVPRKSNRNNGVPISNSAGIFSVRNTSFS